MKLRMAAPLPAAAILASFVSLPTAAQAQAPVTPNLVSACSGVALPRSVVTGIMSGVVTGIVDPVEASVNPIIDVLGNLPILPKLNIDASTLLSDAAAGQPIRLQVLNQAGTVVGAGDRCDTRSDSIGLNTQGGVAIGGNRITGLGVNGQDAFAGEAGSIAFGNLARTEDSAAGAIAFGGGAQVGVNAVGGTALGTGAQVLAAGSTALGAGSIAERGAIGTYAALGLALPQTSAGEVSIGAPGAARQITNVAAGRDATDAVNVAQLAGVAAQVGAIDGLAVRYTDATRTALTLGDPASPPVALGNVANGNVAAGSTDAVNGGQLAGVADQVGVLGGLNAAPVALGNVAAGVAPTDAVNVAQLNGVTDQIGALDGLAVQYTDATQVKVRLGGINGTPVALGNVADGAVVTGSTDAVNGGQLAGVVDQVGVLGGLAVQYNDATQTQIRLGGLNAAPVALGNVAAGVAVTDAVNVGQLASVATQVGTLNDLAVQYSDPTRTQVRLGDLTAAPVALGNVAAGIVATGSTDAVNGGQLAGIVGQIGVLDGLAVQYDDAAHARVTFGGLAAAPVVLGNVAAGTAPTDAVNVAQLTDVADQVGALGGLAVQYDDTTHARVTLGGLLAAPVALGNVGAGLVLAGSTDAVNGGQLFDTNTAVDLNTTAILNLSNIVNVNAAANPLRYSDAANPTVPNAGVPTNDVALVGGAPGPVGIHNVAAGSITAGSTDAVNGGQLYGLAITAVNAVSYDADAAGNRTNSITLAGGDPAAPVTIGNVADGALAAGSTEAVNGGQLFATNTAVQNNTTAISNLSTSIANGAVGPVRYSDAGNPAVPNAGTATNDLALVGAAAGPVGLHNVAAGSINAGSTDAVNGGQVYGLALTAANAVSYDTDAAGNRTNRVTLAGGDAAAPVAIGNVAAGAVAAGSTEAVNGGQLYATNTAVAAAQTTASSALAMGQSSVQYDNAARTEVTLGAGSGGEAPSAPVAVHNVAAGTLPTDAANVSQLASGMSSSVAQSNAYTDVRMQAMSYDLRRVRRDRRAGTAGALAVASLPQPYEAGRGMVAMAGGTYQGQSAFAVGLSKAFSDGHTIVKLSGTYDTRGKTGGAAGVGYQF